MLRRRHELRAVLKNYDAPLRLAVVLDLAAGSLAEMAVATLRGERERSKRVADAWWWNWRHRRSLRRARKALALVRQRPDRVVARMLSRGDRRTALEASPVGAALPAAPVVTALETRFRPDEDLEPARIASSRNRPVVPHRTGWALIGVAVVVLFGVRNLVTGHLPLVGQLLAFPAPSALLRDFFGGWHDAGWQAPGPASPGFGLVGVAGAILLGSTAQVEKLLVLGPILVGAIGMHRLLRPLGSSRARLAGTIAYLGLPLVWNGIAAGDLQALVTFAGMPFVMSRMCRATRLEPFSSPEDPRGWRAVLAEVVPFGLLLAVMAALAPPSLVAVVVLSLAIVLGAAVAGHLAAVGRALGVTAGALGVAFVCCLPWSLTFLQPDARWSVLSGARWGRAATWAGCCTCSVSTWARWARAGSSGGSHSVRLSCCSWRARNGWTGPRVGGSRPWPRWRSPMRERWDGWVRAAGRRLSFWLRVRAVSREQSGSAWRPSRSTLRKPASGGARI